MVRLALSSVAHRRGTFAATFLVLLLGAAIVMAFASLLDTAGEPHVSALDNETLVTMASVVGGWGLVIVLFAVASTLALAVAQRARETALLRSVGATPGQIRRLVVGEAVLVAGAATVAALPLGWVGGRALVAMLHDSGQLARDVDPAFGRAALGLGIGIPVAAAMVAAVLAVRRAGRDAEARDVRLGRGRKVAAGLFLAAGVSCGSVTATVFHGEGIDAMQTAGQASIWASIGLALLAPALVQRVTVAVARPVERRGAPGWLTVQNVRGRTAQMAGALMPIIVFTGIACGTIAMQSIENGADGVVTREAQDIRTLNLVVVGMLAAFAGITLVNALVAATAHRRRELGQQRLIGATPGELVRMVGLEGVALAATGVAAGALASLCTVVPYALARTDALPPASTLGIYALVIGAAVALTLASSVGAARRALNPPAVEAAA